MPDQRTLLQQVPEPHGRLPVIWVPDEDDAQRAGLIAWGRDDNGVWWAGATWPNVRTITLITGWYDAAEVKRQPGETYKEVPRVALVGSPLAWPRLPLWHPKGWPWTSERHEHRVALA